MKKYLFVAVITFLTISCGHNSSNSNHTTNQNTNASPTIDSTPPNSNSDTDDSETNNQTTDITVALEEPQATEAQVTGTTYYISTDGSGVMDGSSFENALPAHSFTQTVASMAAGDRMLISGGEYTQEAVGREAIVISASGTADEPIIIQGVDRGDGHGLPTFIGRWENNNLEYGSDSGQTGMRIIDSSNIILSNIAIRDFKNGVQVKGLTSSTINNINVTRSRVAFAISDSSDLELNQIELLQYRKRGLEFKQSVTDVVINGLLADATLGNPNWITTEFTIGVELDKDTSFPPIANITFNRATSINNFPQVIPITRPYINGDGFSIEDTSYGIKFYNSMAYNNADGGWDDKSFMPYYENIVSLRNKRNFRFWNDTAAWSAEQMGSAVISGPVRLKNVLSAYTRDTQYSNPGIHTQTSLEVNGATFYNNVSSPIHVENNPDANITITDSILWNDSCPSNLVEFESGNSNRLIVENNYTCKENESLKLHSPNPNWKGEPANAFDPIDSNIVGYKSNLMSELLIADRSSEDTNLLKIGLIGDSTVASTYGWGAAFTKLFDDRVEVINQAKNGATLKSAEQELNRLLQFKPDYVLIQFGHNDMKIYGSNEYASRLGAYVDAFQKGGAKVIILSSVTRRHFRNGKIKPAVFSEGQSLPIFARVAEAVAREKKVEFIDLNTISITHHNTIGESASETYNFQGGDKTHFSPEGAHAIAEIILQELKGALPDLERYVK